ncbi:MAG: PAS domain S-box protein [Phycisphaerales bacterium]|nr:MAG: PAS domain S-box protein [Phycisphaerales bacterium]
MLNSEAKKKLIERTRAARRCAKEDSNRVSGATAGQQAADNELGRQRDQLEESVRELSAQLTRAEEFLEHKKRERTRAEEELKVLEFRIRSLIDQTTDAVFCYEYDPPIPTDFPIEEQIGLLYDGVLVECNDVCAKSYGAERAEEVIGGRLTELFGAAPGSLDKLFRALVQGGYRIVDGEGVEKLEDGTVRYYLNNGHGVIEGGKLVRVWGTLRDVTERRKAEEALRESERRYGTVVENAGEGIVMVQDGTLQYVNPYVETTFGLTREEITSRPFIEFIHPDDRERVMDIYTRRLQGEAIQPFYELRVIDKHGATRWIENNGILIEWNGKPATLNFLRDITDRKRAEKALRESEVFLQTVFDGIKDGISVLDRDLNVVRVNKSIEHMYGSEPHLVGRKCYEV